MDNQNFPDDFPMSTEEQVARFRNLPHLLFGLKQHYPDIYRIVTKRRYRGVDAYHEYRYATLLIATALPGWAERNKAAMSQELQKLLVAALIAERYDFPLYFVAPGLLRAVIQSDSLPEVDWQNMHFPFPHLAFVLPKNTLKCHGLDILHITVTRAPVGMYNRSDSPMPIFLYRDTLHITAVNENGETLQRTLADEPFHPDMASVPITAEYGTELYADDLVFLKQLPVIVFNLLYAMAARPEYVEAGHKLKFHKKHQAEIWTPNIIGRKYATRRDPDAETGTHASPRMHWRRGHFRQQAFGPKLAKHRVIWIEPVLVNAKVAGA